MNPGDPFVAINLASGGHLTHGMKLNASAIFYKPDFYELDPKTEQIDFDSVRRKAHEVKPKVIVCGYSAYPRTIDFKRFREIADEVGALVMADVAHIAGLIAGGAHPSPVPHVDVVATTTHKTLRGPRGAMLMSRDQHARALDRAVFPGLQGGPHDHTTAAIAVALHEAAQPSFAPYADAIVANARTLADSLLERGFDLVSGGTDNHLLLVDLTGKEIGGRPAAEALERAGIVCNYNAVPFDTRKPMDPSGIRLGTPAITTRGLGAEHMNDLARWIDEGVEAARRDDEATLARIRADVAELARAFPPPA
jgi:glycine hydroxymethyltransferase